MTSMFAGRGVLLCDPTMRSGSWSWSSVCLKKGKRFSAELNRGSEIHVVARKLQTAESGGKPPFLTSNVICIVLDFGSFFLASFLLYH